MRSKKNRNEANCAIRSGLKIPLKNAISYEIMRKNMMCFFGIWIVLRKKYRDFEMFRQGITTEKKLCQVCDSMRYCAIFCESHGLPPPPPSAEGGGKHGGEDTGFGPDRPGRTPRHCYKPESSSGSFVWLYTQEVARWGSRFGGLIPGKRTG